MLHFSGFKIATRCVAVTVLAVVAVAVTSFSSAGAQTDPLNGTWTFNAAKSTFPHGQAPRRGTVTFQGDGANHRSVNDFIDSQGRNIRAVFMHIYDGVAHPSTGSPFFDASTYTRIDTNTIIFSRLKEGRLVGIGSLITSPDGRTYTGTGTGASSFGRQGNYVFIFDKQ